MLNGWAFSTIVTMSTGQPVTPYISGYPSGALDGGVTGGVQLRRRHQRAAPAGCARNGFTAPGFHNVDFRLGRQFAITERLKLSLIGEAFNLFNHTNISGVNTTAFNYAAAGSGACAGHTNACFVPNTDPFLAPTSTSNLLWGPRQLQISGETDVLRVSVLRAASRARRRRPPPFVEFVSTENLINLQPYFCHDCGCFLLFCAFRFSG